ncbi:hypothetical protein DSL92_03080 [Billgrantia gudaonensis]|uniref:Uncharacterized protein n=1 Tax=Billgrantia gudaonensis TaxID=376427 RepID=A0A3S0R5C1_9GAMM|nr:hypothetical protein DSL92_03080 [Halomonas gudaonensis]
MTAARFQAALRRSWPDLVADDAPLPARLRVVEDSRHVEPGDVFVAVPVGRSMAGISSGGPVGRCRTGALSSGAGRKAARGAGRLARGAIALSAPTVGRTGTSALCRARFARADRRHRYQWQGSVTHFFIAELSRQLGCEAGVVGTLGTDGQAP